MRTNAAEANPNLYVHNVPKDAAESELKNLFSSFGNVERIKLKVNQKIGPQALYAFITFSTIEEAQAALQNLNGYEMRSRKLRVEFQKCRDEDGQQKESNRNFEFRRNDKRENMQYNRKNNQEENTTISMYDHNSSASSGFSNQKRLKSQQVDPSYYDNNYYKLNYYTAQSDAGNYNVEPVVIFLYKLLKVARPDLYSNPNDSRPNKDNLPPVNSAEQLELSQFPKAFEQPIVPPHQTSDSPAKPFISSTSGVELKTKPQEIPVASNKLIWSGSLTRNGRKKVDIDLIYFYGQPVNIPALIALQNLNISHRSSWDDLLKKNIVTTCAIKLTDRLNMASRDQSAFSEHVTYLTKKERTGVIAIDENTYMYLIPPESPIFDNFKGGAIPADGTYLIALIVANNSVQIKSPSNNGVIHQPTEINEAVQQPSALLDLLSNLVIPAKT